MHGAQCGFFRGPFGCCRKQLHFSDFKLGGRKTRKTRKYRRYLNTRATRTYKLPNILVSNRTSKCR